MFLKLLEQWITSKGVQMYDLILYSTSYYKSNTNFIQSDKKNSSLAIKVYNFYLK